MTYQTEPPGSTQALFSLSTLANLVTIVAVTGAVTLNASHTYSANLSAGSVQAVALAAIFGAIGLGGAVAGHLLMTSRRIVHKVTAGLALTIALSVSVIVSLGTQATGRADHAADRSHDAKVAATLDAQRKPLVAELDAMPVTRGHAEVASLLEAARSKISADALRKTGDCSADKIETAAQRKACEPVTPLRIEAARAERRAVLLSEIAGIDAKSASAGPVHSTDAQAENVSWLLSLVGIKATALDTGRALNALLAFCVEAFAVLAASLSAIAGRSVPSAPIVAPVAPPVAAALPVVAPVPAKRHPVIQQRRNAAERVILQALSKRQRLDGSQRSIAEAVGVARSTFGAAVKRLADAGIVTIDAAGVALA